jgi:hypothetical protein
MFLKDSRAGQALPILPWGVTSDISLRGAESLRSYLLFALTLWENTAMPYLTVTLYAILLLPSTHKIVT